MKNSAYQGGSEGEDRRRGRLTGLVVLLLPLGLLLLAFSGRLVLDSLPARSVSVLVGSMVAILVGCELFANAVEHVGRIYELSHQATGGLLAAVGTALPESSIPVIAVFFGSAEHGEAVGVGAILGAPFMLATLALALLGLTVTLAWVSGRRREPALEVDLAALRFDFGVFLVCFGAVLLVSLLDFGWLKKLGALALVGYYAWYVKRSLELEPVKEESYNKILLLERYGGMPLKGSSVAVQLSGGLLFIIAGAKLFVSAVVALALYIKMPALLLSLVLAPLATELPEKYNSITWALKGQDTLAVSNITGAMVFQSMLPVAFGLIFTHWSLGTTELLNIVLALAAGGLLYFSLARAGSLKAKFLVVGGLFYLFYLIRVVWLL